MLKTDADKDFAKAKRLLEKSAEAGRRSRVAKKGGDGLARQACDRVKLEKACEATLASPRDITWREDLFYGGAVSISTTRRRGPRVHIPRRLLEVY